MDPIADVDGIFVTMDSSITDINMGWEINVVDAVCKLKAKQFPRPRMYVFTTQFMLPPLEENGHWRQDETQLEQLSDDWSEILIPCYADNHYFLIHVERSSSMILIINSLYEYQEWREITNRTAEKIKTLFYEEGEYEIIHTQVMRQRFGSQSCAIIVPKQVETFASLGIYLDGSIVMSEEDEMVERNAVLYQLMEYIMDEEMGGEHFQGDSGLTQNFQNVDVEEDTEIDNTCEDGIWVNDEGAIARIDPNIKKLNADLEEWIVNYMCKRNIFERHPKTGSFFLDTNFVHLPGAWESEWRVEEVQLSTVDEDWKQIWIACCLLSHFFLVHVEREYSTMSIITPLVEFPQDEKDALEVTNEINRIFKENEIGDFEIVVLQNVLSRRDGKKTSTGVILCNQLVQYLAEGCFHDAHCELSDSEEFRQRNMIYEIMKTHIMANYKHVPGYLTTNVASSSKIYGSEEPGNCRSIGPNAITGVKKYPPSRRNMIMSIGTLCGLHNDPHSPGFVAYGSPCTFKTSKKTRHGVEQFRAHEKIHHKDRPSKANYADLALIESCNLTNHVGSPAIKAYGPNCMYRGDEHGLIQHQKVFHNNYVATKAGVILVLPTYLTKYTTRLCGKFNVSGSDDPLQIENFEKFGSLCLWEGPHSAYGKHKQSRHPDLVKPKIFTYIPDRDGNYVCEEPNEFGISCSYETRGYSTIAAHKNRFHRDDAAETRVARYEDDKRRRAESSVTGFYSMLEYEETPKLDTPADTFSDVVTNLYNRVENVYKNMVVKYESELFTPYFITIMCLVKPDADETRMEFEEILERHKNDKTKFDVKIFVDSSVTKSICHYHYLRHFTDYSLPACLVREQGYKLFIQKRKVAGGKSHENFQACMNFQHLYCLFAQFQRNVAPSRSGLYYHLINRRMINKGGYHASISENSFRSTFNLAQSNPDVLKTMPDVEYQTEKSEWEHLDLLKLINKYANEDIVEDESQEDNTDDDDVEHTNENKSNQHKTSITGFYSYYLEKPEPFPPNLVEELIKVYLAEQRNWIAKRGSYKFTYMLGLKLSRLDRSNKMADPMTIINLQLNKPELYTASLFADTSYHAAPCHYHHDRLKYKHSEMARLASSGYTIFTKKFEFDNGTTQENRERAFTMAHQFMLMAQHQRHVKEPTEGFSYRFCNKIVANKPGSRVRVPLQIFRFGFETVVRNVNVFADLPQPNPNWVVNANPNWEVFDLLSLLPANAQFD